MSLWTEKWNDFVKETSYKRILKEKGISEDQFWSDYEVYDQILGYIGYPGEILKRVCSLIHPGCTFLDIGAGTGAFAVPIAKKASWVIALDPSSSQLNILKEKASANGRRNIKIVNEEWGRAEIGDLGQVDFTLAAYSLFDRNIENFLKKMLDISMKGAFIVFRAGEMDPLNEFAYGPRAQADYLCLYHILREMGWQFDVEIYPRKYLLPMRLVFQQYRFSERRPEELTAFLRDSGRIEYREDGPWATFSSEDALLYRLS